MNWSGRLKRAKSIDQQFDRLVANLVRHGLFSSPFDMDEFLSRFQRWRGRAIRLEPMPVGGSADGLPYGMLISAAGVDVVFYMPGSTPLHREHIIAHELGHLLFDHASDLAAADLQRVLFPDLDPETVERALKRASYTTRKEREAEAFASAFLRRARYGDRAPAPNNAVTDVHSRIESAWGQGGRRGR
ncbi:ImmA/IrrE family metallo-endopeptidase [Actinocorallia herbida]|uniref:ImmA/IrrE family metallo-endopeptidase n=1 Tax=Actinocorallia herbida TaxID=58109 RepID=UPI001B878110|nr:ImmA/IrrE family metallo-endopeptidase [Actinocorallia herbida]